MRIWMAVASLALWALLTQPETLADFDGMFWHAALGWLQPQLAATTEIGEMAASLPLVPAYR